MPLGVLVPAIDVLIQNAVLCAKHVQQSGEPASSLASKVASAWLNLPTCARTNTHTHTCTSLDARSPRRCTSALPRLLPPSPSWPSSPPSAAFGWVGCSADSCGQQRNRGGEGDPFHAKMGEQEWRRRDGEGGGWRTERVVVCVPRVLRRNFFGQGLSVVA